MRRPERRNGKIKGRRGGGWGGRERLRGARERESGSRKLTPFRIEKAEEEDQEEERDAGDVRCARRVLKHCVTAARLRRCDQAPLAGALAGRQAGSPIPSTRLSSGGCLPVRSPPSPVLLLTQTRARARALKGEHVPTLGGAVKSVRVSARYGGSGAGLEVGC